MIGLSNDDFIRTTEERHYRASPGAAWRRLAEAGDIYLGHYEGWYAVRDEAFYGPDELVERDGVKYAPTGAPVEWVREPSYFFRLSRWLPELLRRYDLPEGHPERIAIAPRPRKNEVVALHPPGAEGLRRHAGEAGFVRLPHLLPLGGAGAGRSRPCDVCVAGCADELHHRRRLSR